MKKKVLGIVIACTILIGLLAFYISHQQATNTPETEATPETAVSEIEKTVDSVETISSNGSLTADESEVTSTEKPEATATPQVTETPEPVATPSPQVTSTPQPTAVPQPVATEVPQPEQSYDDGGAVPDWYDDSWTGYSDDDFDGVEGWGDTVLE